MTAGRTLLTDTAPTQDVDDVERIEAQVAVLFHHVRAMRRDAAPRIHADLQPAAYVLLMRLVNHGPTRASDLADYFGIDKAAVSRDVTHLESLGLAQRMPDPADRRAQSISATAEARRRCRREQTRRRTALRARLGDWSPEQLRAFGDLLEDFNAAAAPLPRTAESPARK